MPPRPRIRIFREFSIHSSAEWMTVWDWMAESHWIRWTFIFLKKFSLEERITRGFGEKTADGLKGTGAGGIDGDDQILDFRGVPVFERLQKEKLFRPGKTVTVGNVVKTVKICLCLLPGDGEAP